MKPVRISAACLVVAAVAAPPAISAKPGPDYTLTLEAAPKTVVFGGKTTTLSGKLTGPDAGGVTVVIEADSTVPLGDKFSPTQLSTTTADDGTYSFTGVRPDANEQYKAVAKTSPDTETAAVQVNVRPKITLAVSDRTPKAGRKVTFSGAVFPAHDGATAQVQRRTKSGSWKTKAEAVLADAGDEKSTYSAQVRIPSDGKYRVKLPKDADHVNGYSRRVKLDIK